MSDARTHHRVATVAGLGAGLYAARNVSTLDAGLARIIGSVVAANLTTALPDVLEPAVHSRHRKLFHSVAALAVTTEVSVQPPSGAGPWVAERAAGAARLSAPRG